MLFDFFLVYKNYADFKGRKFCQFPKAPSFKFTPTSCLKRPFSDLSTKYFGLCFQGFIKGYELG